LWTTFDSKIIRRNTGKGVVLTESSVVNAFKSLNANILVKIHKEANGRFTLVCN
jgi:hypothetical protein